MRTPDPQEITRYHIIPAITPVAGGGESTTGMEKQLTSCTYAPERITAAVVLLNSMWRPAVKVEQPFLLVSALPLVGKAVVQGPV